MDCRTTSAEHAFTPPRQLFCLVKEIGCLGDLRSDPSFGSDSKAVQRAFEMLRSAAHVPDQLAAVSIVPSLTACMPQLLLATLELLHNTASARLVSSLLRCTQGLSHSALASQQGVRATAQLCWVVLRLGGSNTRYRAACCCSTRCPTALMPSHTTNSSAQCSACPVEVMSWMVPAEKSPSTS